MQNEIVCKNENCINKERLEQTLETFRNAIMTHYQDYYDDIIRGTMNAYMTTITQDGTNVIQAATKEIQARKWKKVQKVIE